MRRFLLFSLILIALFGFDVSLFKNSLVFGQTALTASYTISGRVTDGSGNGIAGATVNLSGSQTGSTITDANGNYSFAGLAAGGNYSLSSSKAGQYTSFGGDVNNLSGNQTADLLLVPFINVSVKVNDSAGNGIGGVSIRIDNRTFGSPQTNQFGNVSTSIGIPAVGSVSITFMPVKYGYSFDPASATINSQNGNQFVSFTGTLLNKIDDPQFFVTQHYLDFLNRAPDQVGLSFWQNQIISCGNLDAQCIDIKRQNVSAAYFLSTEFQETGFYVLKIQRVAFGKRSQDAARRITFQQFLDDARKVGNGVVIGQANALPQLDQNKTLYAQSIVTSDQFIARYPTALSASAYADALFSIASVMPSDAERQDAINAFGSGDATGRAAALRKIAESNSVKNAEFNAAFVLMEYFGYLRRNPTDLPDTDDSGYQFWLKKLNDANGDYIKSEMVRSFIISPEYRKRFGNQ